MNNKRITSICIMAFLLILISLAVGTFAWFINNDTVRIENGADMSIQVGKRLQIAYITGEEDENLVYGDKIVLNYSDKLTTISDCTGNGIDFLSVRDLDDEKQPTSYEMIDPSDPENGCVIEVKVSLKSSFPVHVFLDGNKKGDTPNTYVLPKSLDENDNQSITGMFTANYIAGCARVSFSEVLENGDEKLRFIWVPNDKYEINVSDPASGVNREGRREGSYGYMSLKNNIGGKLIYDPEDVENIKYTTNEILDGEVLVGNFPNLCNVVPIVTFDQPAGIEVSKTVVIRIWFEGTDREAHSSLNQGAVKFQFSFEGKDKIALSADPNDKWYSEELKKFDNIVFDEETNRFVYSDGTNVGPEVIYSYNGIDWYSVNLDFNPWAGANTRIYLKLRETTIAFSSDLRTDNKAAYKMFEKPLIQE